MRRYRNPHSTTWNSVTNPMEAALLYLAIESPALVIPFSHLEKTGTDFCQTIEQLSYRQRINLVRDIEQARDITLVTGQKKSHTIDLSALRDHLESYPKPHNGAMLHLGKTLHHPDTYAADWQARWLAHDCANPFQD